LLVLSLLLGELSRIDASGPQSPQNAAGLAPIVEVQTEDYTVARAGFRTKLLRKIPAPQRWKKASPPAGVNEVEFPSGELRLKAWLSKSDSQQRKRPAVVFLHGGFAFDGEDWDLCRPNRDAGFIVMAPILRGENGQPGSFTLWYDEVDDVLAAALFLSTRADVDPKRLFVAGSSAGGTLALLAAMASDRFRSVASFSASPDQALIVKHAKLELPFDKTDARELVLRSPLAYSASLKCPARIYYASEDHFVLTSERTAALAKEKRLDVEAVKIEGDHGSIVPSGIKQSITFFQAQ
jgi:dienelactone hydrolase